MFEFEEDENGTVEFSVEDGLGEVIEWVSQVWLCGKWMLYLIK